MIFKIILVLCLIVMTKTISESIYSVAKAVYSLQDEIKQLPRYFGKQFENLKVNVNYNEANND